MDKQDLEMKKELMEEMERGEQAELVSQLLTDWLEDYQEMTIAYLKSCPANQVMDLRNKLVASEAFKAYLDALIARGQMAKAEFDKEESQTAYAAQLDWYKHLEGGR